MASFQKTNDALDKDGPSKRCNSLFTWLCCSMLDLCVWYRSAAQLWSAFSMKWLCSSTVQEKWAACVLIKAIAGYLLLMTLLRNYAQWQIAHTYSAHTGETWAAQNAQRVEAISKNGKVNKRLCKKKTNSRFLSERLWRADVQLLAMCLDELAAWHT